jgi:hypothetical protein
MLKQIIRTLKLGNLRMTITIRATIMILDIITILRGIQLEPSRIYSQGN